MISLKTPEEICLMREGGKKLKTILKKVLDRIAPGVSTGELDSYAEGLIQEAGGTPSFKTVPDYSWATCIGMNDVVVHGVPKKDVIIEKGDIVSVDIGLLYKELHTDTSWTISVQNPNTDNFLQAGEMALEKAFRQMKIGNRVGHISQAIQEVIEGSGYSLVQELVGHGIGRELHEEPEIPGVLTTDIGNTPKLEVGMALAVEVIYAKGSSKIVTDEADGWTIRTKDGTISGLFEKTAALTSSGLVFLT